MSFRLIRSLCLVAAAAAVISTPAFADNNLVTNGGFETGDLTGWTTTDMANVFANGGCVEGGTYCNPHTGSYYAALGTVVIDGALSQQVTDVAGQSYALSFWLASDGGTPNDFSANFNGTQLLSLTNIPSGDPNNQMYVYTEYTYQVTGTGSDTISFGERNDPGYLALDDVSLTTSPVPEPSSLALLGTGVLAAAGAVRRRLGSR